MTDQSVIKATTDRCASAGSLHRTRSRQLLDHAADVLRGVPMPSEPPVDLKALHAMIGQLALESDFSEGALTKAGLLSTRK